SRHRRSAQTFGRGVYPGACLSLVDRQDASVTIQNPAPYGGERHVGATRGVEERRHRVEGWHHVRSRDSNSAEVGILPWLEAPDPILHTQSTGAVERTEPEQLRRWKEIRPCRLGPL